jgi:peptidyl-prolyl cis-trans isomerase D
MWFVFVLLGVALVAFMFMDSSGPGGGGGNTTALSVNGEKITAQEFQRLQNSASSQGLTGNALSSKVYDDILTRTIVGNESEKLGLGVGEEELEELLYGSKLSPIIQQVFRNNRTGQLDFQQLQETRTRIEAGDDERLMSFWNQKTKEVKALEVQNKIAKMVEKGIYTPTWMAEELSKTNSISATIEYAKIPLTAMADSEVQLTDSDYKAYMDDNSSMFNNKEEGRVVEYFNFEILPTAADSVLIQQNLSKTIERFRNAENDSIFVLQNNGNYIDAYFKTDDMPEVFQNVVTGMELGQITEPILSDRFYAAMKLIDKKVVADSVGLSHIYRPVDLTDITGRQIARDLLDSIKTEVEAGRADWDAMALANSLDQTNSAKGGDLGKITQGTFFPGINRVAFFTGTVGNLYTVESPNGIHLIRVDERVFDSQDPKYKVAFINESIEPSQETIDNITTKASNFITSNRTLEEARNGISEYPEATIKTSKVLKKGDYEFEEFGFRDDSREIIIWAFNDDTEVGDVALDMYSFRDPQFNYETNLVIPAIQAKTKKGMTKLSDVKSSITPQVREYVKARKIAEMVKGKSVEEVSDMMESSSYGLVKNVTTSSTIIKDLGFEPKVVASVISTGDGQTSAPIIGNGGIYVIKVSDKVVNSNTNTVFAKQMENSRSRQNVGSTLMSALKEQAEVKDKRMDFGM